MLGEDSCWEQIISSVEFGRNDASSPSFIDNDEITRQKEDRDQCKGLGMDAISIDKSNIAELN